MANPNDKFATKEDLAKLEGRLGTRIAELTGQLETGIATLSGKLETQRGKFATAGYIAGLVLAIVTAGGVVANIVFREAPAPIPPELIELANSIKSARTDAKDILAQPDALEAAARAHRGLQPQFELKSVGYPPDFEEPPHREEAPAPSDPYLKKQLLKKHPPLPSKDQFSQ